MTAVTSGLEILQRYLQAELDKEIIGGTKLGEVIEHVDLDMAHELVCPQATDEHGMNVPPVAKVTALIRGRYILKWDGFEEIVGAEALRIMRARFLLWRGVYYERIANGGLGYQVQQEVIAEFFGGSLFIPNILLPEHRRTNRTYAEQARPSDRIGTVTQEGRGRGSYARTPMMTLPADESLISEEQITTSTLRISCLGCGEQEILNRVGKSWGGWLAFRRLHRSCDLKDGE